MQLVDSGASRKMDHVDCDFRTVFSVLFLVCAFACFLLFLVTFFHDDSGLLPGFFLALTAIFMFLVVLEYYVDR